MPEGHTIHRLAQDLGADLVGQRITASSPQGRFAAGADLIDGSTLVHTEAAGKHLFLRWEDERVIHVHLGLFGRFRRRTQPAPAPTDGVRLRLAGPARVWDLSGPTICTLGGPELVDGVASRLGPDPLHADAAGAAFIDRLVRRRTPVGAALLDQSLIAGIGNVYRAELLFLLGVDPRTPASRLAHDQGADLWDLAVSALAQGVRLNRIVTVTADDAAVRDVRSIPRGERLYVYKREGLPCRRCGTEIELLELANRKTWTCPTCQQG